MNEQSLTNESYTKNTSQLRNGYIFYSEKTGVEVSEYFQNRQKVDGDGLNSKTLMKIRLRFFDFKADNTNSDCSFLLTCPEAYHLGLNIAERNTIKLTHKYEIASNKEKNITIATIYFESYRGRNSKTGEEVDKYAVKIKRDQKIMINVPLSDMDIDYLSGLLIRLSFDCAKFR